VKWILRICAITTRYRPIEANHLSPENRRRRAGGLPTLACLLACWSITVPAQNQPVSPPRPGRPLILNQTRYRLRAGERAQLDALPETLDFIHNAQTAAVTINGSQTRGFAIGPSTSGNDVLLAASLTMKPGEYAVTVLAIDQSGEQRTAAADITVDALPVVPSGGSAPPVVLLNGWQFSVFPPSTCPIAPTGSAATFGSLASQLVAPAIYFFDNCVEQSVNGSSIEELGVTLGQYLDMVQYADGTLVPQVDLVSHSMGGLIVRSYLAGLQASDGLAPVLNPRVRKFIEIATPNFGSFLAANYSDLLANGTQAAEMVPGSAFLWSVGTWNQHGDDLRGVDAIAIIGNAGYWRSSIFASTQLNNASDGVVSLTSASLNFSRDPSRTRILPYCHIGPESSAYPYIDCSGKGGIANVDEAPETGQVILSFLAGTSAWQYVGFSNQTQFGGGYLALENAAGTQYTPFSSVSLGSVPFESGWTNTVFYNEFVPPETGTFTVNQTIPCGPFTVTGGTFSIFRCKFAPMISSVGPLLPNVAGRVVMSGGSISVSGVGFGQQCSGCQVLAYPGPVALQVSSWSDAAITALLPSTFDGIAQVVVQAAAGSDSITFMASPPPAPPTISLSSTQLQFAYTTGGASPVAQTVNVANSGGGTLTWSATSNMPWLAATSSSSSLTVSVSPSGLSTGPHNGAITVSASGATNSPQTISVALMVSGTSGLAASITATAGGGQIAMLNAPFSTALQATVYDSLGNPVPNVVVTFTAPSSGASGTFPGPSFIAAVTTNSSGVATAPTFTANGTPGQYDVTTAVAGVNQSASFPLTNTSAAPPPPSGAPSVLPQFAFGGGWYSALYFTNPTSAAVSFPVNFVSDAGTPLVVPSLGGSTTQVNLAPYGTAIIEAPDAGSLLQGYAKFALPSGVYGYGVFRQSVAGRPDQEAVVPFSDAGAISNTLTWDETNFVTAVAIVNPSSTASTVAVTTWDENGNTIGTSSILLAPSSKTETTLRTLPGLSGMVGQRGSAQFAVSTGNVAVLGLRFNGSAFTSIPTTSVTPLNPEPSVLPQLAFGGGWYSALYFTNLTGAAASFSVNFVSDAGTPLIVPSLGGSTTQVNLAPYGTAMIEAPDAGSLLEGYAVFTLPSEVCGYGVFRQSVAGRPDQEAVVPFSGTAATSSTLTWDETNFITAVAIVNPSSMAATVAVTLWDENGNTIGTSSILLAPSSKTETTLRTLPGLSGMVGQRGFAQFAVSAGNVAVLGLRFDGSAFTSIPTTTATQIVP
jgi:P pilus assembly chaperone PapD/pimeloyl-ACP methyl ester carboxylesterase